jgi:prevent-host-death family protein
MNEVYMSITTVSSREFNQDASGVKRSAKNGPVFITDRGRPSHVLMTIDEYHRLAGRQESIADLLSMPLGVADIDFDPPRLTGCLFRPVDFS